MQANTVNYLTSTSTVYIATPVCSFYPSLIAVELTQELMTTLT